MRTLLAAALAFAVAAAPGWAKPPAVNPDPMTVSGRFELPRAAAAYAGRLTVGEVTIDPSLASRTKLEPAALQAALRAAAERSLQNFGYLSVPPPRDATRVDLAVLPLEVVSGPDGALFVVRLRAASGEPCLAREVEGRFKVLARKRSGAGRRAFAFGTAVGLGFAGVNGGAFLTSQLDQASAQNKALNAGLTAPPGEGVAPGFGEAAEAAYGAEAALQLALADYLQQVGERCAAGAEK